MSFQPAHWQFLEQETCGWYETATHFFVHANAYPDCSLAEQPDFMPYWEAFDNPPPHESGKIMVCGHTSSARAGPAASAMPFALIPGLAARDG